MRASKSAKSPWGQRLYFDSQEFETMMDELRDRCGADSFVEGKGVDVDLITLRGFRCDPDYISLPENVLGRTVFSPSGDVRMQLSRQLAEEAERDNVARRRLRTTLAHEVGHVACHRELFLKDQATMDLFVTGENEPNRPNTILCRDSSVGAHRLSG